MDWDRIVLRVFLLAGAAALLAIVFAIVDSIIVYRRFMEGL